MNERYYKWIALALGVVVVGLLVYIFTRPKPLDAAALNADLNQFKASLNSWEAQYGKTPNSSTSEAALATDLSTFSAKLQEYQQ